MNNYQVPNNIQYFNNMNPSEGYPYGYPSGILSNYDMNTMATLAAANGSSPSIRIQENIPNPNMMQNQYSGYGYIPNPIQSSYSPFINPNTPVVNAQQVIKRNEVQDPNDPNYKIIYDADGRPKRVYTGPSYYDSETMQTIKNDMPLQAAPNSPLEQFGSNPYIKPYVPGSKGYIEAEKPDGTIDRIYYPTAGKNDGSNDLTTNNVSGNTNHVSGIFKPGGFNPVTGLYTPPEKISDNARDCKPIMQMINEALYKPQPVQVKPPAQMTVLGPTNIQQNTTPQSQQFFGVNYNYNQQNQNLYPQNYMNNGYNNIIRYNGPFNSPYGYGYMTPSYYGNGYVNQPINEFNNYVLNEILYQENPSCFDSNEMLASIVLSDAEREKINHNKGNFYETNYYNGYVMNSYAANQARQEAMEKARQDHINYFTMLSRIAHAYDNSEFNEQKMKERFDPMSNMRQATTPVQNVFFNPMNSTKEQIEKQRFESIQLKCMYVDRVADQYLNQMSNFNIQKANAIASIKASHDALIGVKPGEHYSLSQYLDNGYKIGVNNEMKKLKSLSRNGRLRYNPDNVRQTLIQKGVIESNQIPAPVATSKDEEFLTLEQAFKSAYEINKSGMPFPKPDHPQSLMIEFGDGSKKPKVTSIDEDPEIKRLDDAIKELDPEKDADLIRSIHFLKSKIRWNKSMEIDAIKRGMTY